MMSCGNQRKDGLVGWDAFLPDVEPYVRGAPAEVILNAIRNAAVDVARSTQCIRRYEEHDVYKDVENYYIDPPNDHVVHALAGVSLFQQRLTLLPRYPQPGESGVFFEPPRSVFLAPPPNRDGRKALEIEYVLLPAADACGGDPVLFNLFRDAVAARAVHDLIMMKNTPWYSPNEVGRWNAIYRRLIVRGRDLSRSGFQTGPLYVAKPKRAWY